MKKLISVLMFACMLVTPFAAFATAEVSVDAVMNWEDYAEITETIEGDFLVHEELGVQFWLPSFFKAFPVDEGMASFGVINVFATEDGAYQIAVSAQSFEEVGGLVPYLQMLVEQGGASNVEDALINGIYAVSYDVESADGVCVLFPIDENSGLTFMFYPISDEGFASMAYAIMASFQAIE